MKQIPILPRVIENSSRSFQNCPGWSALAWFPCDGDRGVEVSVHGGAWACVGVGTTVARFRVDVACCTHTHTASCGVWGWDGDRRGDGRRHVTHRHVRWTDVTSTSPRPQPHRDGYCRPMFAGVSGPVIPSILGMRPRYKKMSGPAPKSARGGGDVAWISGHRWPEKRKLFFNSVPRVTDPLCRFFQHCPLRRVGVGMMKLG